MFLTSSSYGAYMSQLIRFLRVCSNVSDFNNSNLFLTGELLKQVINIIKFLQYLFKNSPATGHIRASILRD